METEIEVTEEERPVRRRGAQLTPGQIDEIRRVNFESRALLDALSDRIPGEHLEGCRSLSDAGEYAELVDVIAAILVERKIPVTPAERDALREVIGLFSQPMDGYAYLGNPDMTIAGINVVQPEHGDTI